MKLGDINNLVKTRMDKTINIDRKNKTDEKHEGFQVASNRGLVPGINDVSRKENLFCFKYIGKAWSLGIVMKF